ncbi:hypothetical protein DM01DRAFT_1370670 [Hesseltinella vesiculosa]|uniref:Cytochrome c oxidase assembly protein n=1 Tax=Hesseltinella vesiculosa TaxID=101127 RepID=A0A1X2GUF5_9FUNG|nr:hypothetical protein DM01DRAFT_1370670 [Hesseltinella vesiculosa]
MSTAAKVTLGASIAFCCGSIYGVHYIQRYEQELLRQGLIKDDERRLKKEQQRNNERELMEQQALHAELLKTQTVSTLPSNEPISQDDTQT